MNSSGVLKEDIWIENAAGALERHVERGQLGASWPDTLNDVGQSKLPGNGEDPECRSIWEETSHVTYWRRVTLDRIAG